MTTRGAPPAVGTATAKGFPGPEDYKYKFRQPGFMKNHHGCMVNYPFWETLEDVEKFEARPDDVVIVTFPKCGTTFMSAVVSMIQNDADPKTLSTGPPLEQKILYLELTFPNMPVGLRPIDRINGQKSPRTFFTHLSYDALPKSILKTAKIIYVARNPKDTIVSMHNFTRATPSMGFTGTIEETFETFVDNTCIYAPYFDHIANFWSNSKNHSNIFFATFEGLVKDFKHLSRDLGRFLSKELTEEQLDTIMYHCNFDQMKANDNVNRSGIAKTGHWDFSISPFLRAGKVGNWQLHFSPELNKRVDEWIAAEQGRLQEKLSGFKFVYV